MVCALPEYDRNGWKQDENSIGEPWPPEDDPKHQHGQQGGDGDEERILQDAEDLSQPQR
jgi:hypothetical protein